MVCPKCRMEYQDWATECSDCHVPLISGDEQREGYGAEIAAMHPVKLVSVSSGIQAELVAGLLEELGIPVLQKNPGSGGYMQVCMGFSVYGTEIYVDEADYERAKEVLCELEELEEEDSIEMPQAGVGHGTKIVILSVVAIFFLLMASVLAGALVELSKTF